MNGTRVRVRVPATTANLGPGFDCLGMALDLWNEVCVEMATPGTPVEGGDRADLVSVSGEGASVLPTDRRNLVYRTVEDLVARSIPVVPDLKVRCHNEIPLARGLGSSAAAIVGGLVAANALLGRLDGKDTAYASDEILEMAVRAEGHPDNVAAALLGGLQLVIETEEGVLTAPVPVPEGLNSVVFIPDVSIATDEARAVLPVSVTREDAVYNMGRVGLLVNAMCTGRLDLLRTGTDDRLHQPYRQRLSPAMKVIFQAALDAGALGVFLSGSGSTILALARGREMTVAYEMAEAARQACVQGRVKITRPTALGAHPVPEDET